MDQEKMLKGWLTQDYVAKYWHGVGLQNTFRSIQCFLNHEKTPFTLWIAYDGDTPFAYLMTSSIDLEKEPLFVKYCASDAKAMSLDLLIGNRAYLGKGLSARLIQEFLLQKCSSATDLFIDPGINNPKAIHVYEKAGFQKCEEFIPSWDPETPCVLMHLKMAKTQVPE